MFTMYRMSYQAVLLGLFCFCVQAKDNQPTPFEADYIIRVKGTKIARMTRHFSRLESGMYQYRSETRTMGLISLFRKDHIIETSNWHLDDQRLVPIDYYYDHSGGNRDRRVSIKFDWENSRITNSIDGSSWKMPTTPDILDKLLYQLALMYDLQAGKRSFNYTVADGGKTKVYNFEIIGEEIVATPLGDLNTIKLERHKPNSRRKSTLWCAKDLEYLPIKVENIEKDGKVTVAIINSLDGITY